VIETRRGGSTELLGGLLYPVQKVDSDAAAFVSDGSEQSLVAAVSAHERGTNYALQALISNEGVDNRLLSRDAIQRGRFGSFIFNLEGP
jgi:hypothetical protein